MTTGTRRAFGSIRSVVGYATWLVCGLAIAGTASAGSFKVNPVQLNLPPDRQATSLKMTNSDSAPVSVRVVPYTWTQVDGRDVYSPTDNVIVSPPIFTIPAGSTQLVRIGLKSRDGHSAYRVIFDEIPRQRPGDGQVQIALRLNLPLYLLPKGDGKANVSWSAWRDAAGELVVEGRNNGSVHHQVVELAADHAGRRHLLSTQMGVVLPGSVRQWKVDKRPDFPVGAPLLLRVKGSAGEIQTQIVLGTR